MRHRVSGLSPEIVVKGLSVFCCAECERHGGICFLIIRFSRYNTQYVLTTEQLVRWWEQRLTGRKSIPLSFIEKEAIEVPTRALPSIDYLTVLDQWLD